MAINRIEKFHDFKKSILIVACVISVIIYNLGTEFLAPSRNVISAFKDVLFKTEYRFYSGNKLGNYHFIGGIFELSSQTEGSKHLVKNVPSDGAGENLLTVSSTPNSLGFIQEDTIESSMFDKNFIDNKQVLYIVDPLEKEDTFFSNKNV
jgi:hypothetical protein